VKDLKQFSELTGALRKLKGVIAVERIRKIRTS